MNKIIRVKKELTFRELMEYIIQNDVSGTFEDCDGKELRVDKNGTFDFDMYHYGYGETYQVEVEITEDMEFGTLVGVIKDGMAYLYRDVSINDVLNDYSKSFYALIDGELVKIWEVS